MSSAAHRAFIKDSWQTPRNARTLRAFMALQNQEIGERIRQLRDERGNPPQTVVAEALGVSERTYQTWEYGEAKPSYRSLQKLAGYFGVGEDFILTGIERERAAKANGTPNLFASQPTNLEQRLEAIERALADRLDHERKIDAMLREQTAILNEIRRVMSGLPDDEALRLFNEGARQIAAAAQAGKADPAASSAAQAGTGRRPG